MVDHLKHAATILQERTAAREAQWLRSVFAFEVGGEAFELMLDVYSEPDSVPTTCLACSFQIATGGATGNGIIYSAICKQVQPKVSLTRSVISAEDDEPFIINQIFVDGDPVTVAYQEFDLLFYTHYVNRFIQSEPDLINFLKKFDSSFSGNRWYQKREGAWLHRLISNSRWNSTYLKALFGCLQFEDGLTFLESDELKKHGYELLMRAFKVRYANTSTSIVTDVDVAEKLEAWIPRTQFNNHINQLFDKQIQSFKTHKTNYFDAELKEWRQNDGSLEAKKKIFLSQFSRYPEFEAKRRIIQKLIRKAENEVRTEKGFTVVGTLVNESILYSRLKEHFSAYNVLSQYRPKWLGRQSLDIYIEELKVAVEYQGDQHIRPIAFYGGELGFEKTKHRDQKKLERCRRNGCKLVYVYPGYKFEEVIHQITVAR